MNILRRAFLKETEEEENEEFQDTIEKKTRLSEKTDDLICNCCNKNKVIRKEKDSNFFSKPIIDYIGGFVLEDVCICDECADKCSKGESADQKTEMLWIKGKINKLIGDKDTIEREIAEKKKEMESLEVKSVKYSKLIDVYSMEFEKRQNKLDECLQQNSQ